MAINKIKTADSSDRKYRHEDTKDKKKKPL
jgi:hypothetical protein